MAAKFLILLTIVAGLSACSTPTREDLADTPDLGSSEVYLFRASNAIHDPWVHMLLKGETEYKLAILGNRVAIRAVGRNSASGLLRHISMDARLCPELAWTWSATELQQGANLYHKEADDVAASIFLLFGDPGPMSSPEPVPTLRYVWTTDHVAPETIIDNPYMAGVVKSLVVRTGKAEPGTWYRQQRNVMTDFLAAFGRLPEDKIHAIVLFTDNDQTEEPVEAYYGWAKAICNVESPSVEAEFEWD